MTKASFDDVCTCDEYYGKGSHRDFSFERQQNILVDPPSDIYSKLRFLMIFLRHSTLTISTLPKTRLLPRQKTKFQSGQLQSPQFSASRSTESSFSSPCLIGRVARCTLLSFCSLVNRSEREINS